MIEKEAGIMSCEDAIVSILKANNSVDEASATAPDAIKEACAVMGMDDGKAIDAAVVALIDSDTIEYEMDDQNIVTHLWLL